jgi:hypothetical protein
MSVSLLAVYSANLTAFLAESRLQTPITSLEDLIHNDDFAVGMDGGGSLEYFFRVSVIIIIFGSLQSSWHFMSVTYPSHLP